MTSSESPSQVVYHKKSRQLALTFNNIQWHLDAELLRVYSPSAEVRGHGNNTAKLQTGKKQVSIEGVEPVGNYAIKLTFSDGHDSGIYSWAYLRDLAENSEIYWEKYLQDIKAAGASRLPIIPVGQWKPGE